MGQGDSLRDTKEFFMVRGACGIKNEEMLAWCLTSLFHFSFFTYLVLKFTMAIKAMDT